MDIQNSKITDIDEIFGLYKMATNLQKAKQVVPWPEFDRTLIETEIHEKRQWKLLINSEIACIWATTFSDPLIWGERNFDPSVYIHRIATKPGFNGKKLVAKIAEWARQYAKENNKAYIRMDTVGQNKKLIEHYGKCGFEFLGLSNLTTTDGLPAHYHNATVSLFQINVKPKT